MTLSQLADIGQVVGAVAIVVSLFYVAYQIRQNTSAVQAATSQAIHDNYASWYQALAGDFELSSVAVQGLKDYRSLSEIDKARFISLFMAFLSYSQNAFLKWRSGLLPQSLWLGWELVIMNLVSSPGGQAFWQERGYLFGSSFRSYVEEDLMTRQPHPSAMPLGAFKIAH